MKSNILKNLISLACITAPLPLLAEWTLVEDYEDGQHPEGFFDINTWTDGVGDGGNFIVEDPLDSSNLANFVTADTGEENFFNFNVAVFPLQQEIPEGSVATFYHRHMKEGYMHDIVWGLTGFPPPNPERGSYYLFEELTVSVQYSGVFNYDSRSGTYYMGVDGFKSRIWSPILDTWYHTWLVIDLATNLYDLYIQGGQYAEPTLVQDDIPFKDPAAIPGAAFQPLTHFFVFSITGSSDNPRGRDPFYLDDLYVDYTGMNLTVPSGGAGEAWYGYALRPDGYVDTDPWMGWVYVSQDPWIWSVDLAKWVYVPSDSGWVYLPK